jgi:hypothetical protein
MILISPKLTKLFFDKALSVSKFFLDPFQSFTPDAWSRPCPLAYGMARSGQKAIGVVTVMQKLPQLQPQLSPVSPNLTSTRLTYSIFYD